MIGEANDWILAAICIRSTFEVNIVMLSTSIDTSATVSFLPPILNFCQHSSFAFDGSVKDT